MTDVSQILGGGSQALNMKQATGGQELGKQDFLKLLVTQLQNQDPMNPKDPAKFSSQLAQFSSLEQMTNINQNIKDMSQSTDAINRMSSLSMLGKQVVLRGDSFTLGSEPVDLGYRLQEPAQQVTLSVKDASGATVAQVRGDETSAGRHFVTWDGTGVNGEELPPGTYSLQVDVVRDGEQSTGTPLLGSKVTGVDDLGGSNTLLTSMGEVKLQDVLQVRQ